MAAMNDYAHSSFGVRNGGRWLELFHLSTVIWVMCESLESTITISPLWSHSPELGLHLH